MARSARSCGGRDVRDVSFALFHGIAEVVRYFFAEGVLVRREKLFKRGSGFGNTLSSGTRLKIVGRKFYLHFSYFIFSRTCIVGISDFN